MTFTHSIMGIAAVATIIGGVASVIAPPAKPPAPIVVNSLEWHDGIVRQDRTVTTSGAYTAVWRAEVRSAKTGAAVKGCSGSDWWPYPAGRLAPSMPLSEWVGGADCHLPEGDYYLWLKLAAGEWSTTARSDVFRVGAE